MTPFTVWFRVFSLLRKNGSGPWILKTLAVVNLKVKRNMRKVHWRYFTLFTLEEGRTVPNWFWEGCRLICLVWNSTVSPGSTVPHQTDQFI